MRYYAVFNNHSQRFYGDSLTALIIMIRGMAEGEDKNNCEWECYSHDDVLVAQGGRKNHKRFREL